MNRQQQRVSLVLKRLDEMSKNDEDDCRIISEWLDDLLDNMLGSDFFGT